MYLVSTSLTSFILIKIRTVISVLEVQLFTGTKKIHNQRCLFVEIEQDNEFLRLNSTQKLYSVIKTVIPTRQYTGSEEMNINDYIYSGMIQIWDAFWDDLNLGCVITHKKSDIKVLHVLKTCKHDIIIYSFNKTKIIPL